MSERRRDVSASNDGLSARDVAASALFSVFVEKRAFDDAFAKAAEARGLAPRDRAFARLIAATAMRRRGSLNAVIGRFLQKPLPKNQGRLEPIMLSAAAQLLILGTPPHAAISLAVDQCRVDSAARRFDKLANAVLRRVANEGPGMLATLDAIALDIPAWLLARWTAAYGAETAREVAAASLKEAPLDLTVKGEPAALALKFDGVVLPTGSVRVFEHGRIEELADYDVGDWWVQDAAAALPVRLFGDLAGRTAIDICAAPGGKTAQLAIAGAEVTALDKSPGRLKRLATNLARLNITAETVVADAALHAPGRQFDAVLIDAPCTATGTIRRHPDILHLKRAEDVPALAALQASILAKSADLVRPGGALVYCTCSLEPEEGVEQIERFLADRPDFSRRPASPAEFAIASSSADEVAGWLTPQGDLRTLPSHLASQGGIDGFFAARLVRNC